MVQGRGWVSATAAHGATVPGRAAAPQGLRVPQHTATKALRALRAFDRVPRARAFSFRTCPFSFSLALAGGTATTPPTTTAGNVAVFHADLTDHVLSLSLHCPPPPHTALAPSAYLARALSVPVCVCPSAPLRGGPRAGALPAGAAALNSGATGSKPWTLPSPPHPTPPHPPSTTL